MDGEAAVEDPRILKAMRVVRRFDSVRRLVFDGEWMNVLVEGGWGLRASFWSKGEPGRGKVTQVVERSNVDLTESP